MIWLVLQIRACFSWQNIAGQRKPRLALSVRWISQISNSGMEWRLFFTTCNSGYQIFVLHPALRHRCWKLEIISTSTWTDRDIARESRSSTPEYFLYRWIIGEPHRAELDMNLESSDTLFGDRLLQKPWPQDPHAYFLLAAADQYTPIVWPWLLRTLSDFTIWDIWCHICQESHVASSNSEHCDPK